MREKVYCAHDQHDGLILQGTADINGRPYYFLNIFDDDYDDYTAIYELTPLPESIFNLEIDNWKYWLDWLNSNQRDPHPVHYANFRKEDSIESIQEQKMFSNPDNLLRAEKYYQNHLMFTDFLKKHTPTIYAKATFHGDRDGIDTTVEWTTVDKPDIHTSS